VELLARWHHDADEDESSHLRSSSRLPRSPIARSDSTIFGRSRPAERPSLLREDVDMNRSPITNVLPVPGPFWTFNREERNAVAVLFGLLTRPGNLREFCSRFGWVPEDLGEAEVAVEWTMLRDLWNHHSKQSDATTLRSAILTTLSPSNASDLQACSVLDFHTHFGAVPRPSATYVQSPSNWSVSRFDATIPDNDEFVATCRFKWAFNIKPDLVVQTPSGRVLCIEAKWDSGEGSYPSSELEKAIFTRRGPPYISQTEVQRYLVNDVLGFDGEFVFLARKQVETAAGRAMTWGEALDGLDRSGSPAFVEDWCRDTLGPAATERHGSRDSG